VQDEPAYSGIDSHTYPPEMSTETITVQTERLDDHLPEGWSPSFVKIDVEGTEGLVIRGAMDILRSAKPVVAFEHGWGGGDHFGISDQDVYSLLCDDVGLRLFNMDGRGPLDFEQFKDELATGERWNWLAHQ
jgi:hypothetical protein